MTLPFYTSPEQLMRERSDLARKGIARGRSVVVLTYSDGVLFVADNPSNTLHKVSEIYDRIGFAAVGRYPEFDSLRVAGIRHADLTGYAYDRKDVSGQTLANVYAKALDAVFTERVKPYEVEVCVAEVGSSQENDKMFRLSYDGSIDDESRFVVMGGQADTIRGVLREDYQEGLELAAALRLAVRALGAEVGTGSGSGGAAAPKREISVNQLEVAVLERFRPNRAFRRIPTATLATLVEERSSEDAPDGPAAE
ncbi:proteasome subunit alpha [Actinoalloteichus sp. AHMU CJ021]|uniref:Proteasome subunit alpha n=1 Tax=Actinoalloteichus caeruleus DSM 43889 TaxID=1120930 RepID=A0ABT1JCM9_ACTCY|nr:proteasome subunit alpha [Actinoalloteichus caeruleus]AUS80665.1 proteasome subunit alpha [Actinoalloteichus sp. AHMU CJ021]MCP2330049.1 proteasome alpha subunit [Actinoalloteichus caeruleus DSM 43889]